ncbi:MAG: putative inorganic carbon transporter subunit DabA [Gammaproteobacteria bacterium]
MKNVIQTQAIQSSIEEAANILPDVWPLQSFIALNPLWGLKEKPFRKALSLIREYLPIKGFLSINEYLDLQNRNSISGLALKQSLLEAGVALDEIQFKDFSMQLIDQKIEYSKSESSVCVFPISIRDELQRFISRFFEEKNKANPNNLNIWRCWMQEQSLTNVKYQAFIEKLPNEPLLALQTVLSKLEIDSLSLTQLFQYLLTCLPGWHGLIKWIESRNTETLFPKHSSLTEIALIWCCYAYIEKVSFKNIRLYKSSDLSTLPLSLEDAQAIWQRAFELTYQDALLASINQNSSNATKPSAQFIFCIDVRSEALRRHLENVDDYETFGYAGFFGTTFWLKKTGSSSFQPQAPALIEPNMIVQESTQQTFFSKLKLLLNQMLSNSKKNKFSTFAFFEVIGSYLILPLLQKTFAPKLGFKKTNQNYSYSHSFLAPSQIDETASNMAAFLKTIGITTRFAPIVVICGHQAKTVNNPYHASFECGACGGHSGKLNAKMTCDILNHPQIRSLLAQKNVFIPDETIFVPAVHETTTDELIIDSTGLQDDAHLKRIGNSIKDALLNLKSEKQREHAFAQEDDNKAYHYAELIPELGLLNNAAIIIGPRRLTANANLNGRVFLHSYEWEQDPDGHILENILKGPMIVAHWINAQYYFSTTDPDIYGAGNKAIHNIVSNLGVISGNQSDLKIGLPLQSLFYQNKRIHDPLRLLVVIEAPSNIISAILNRNPDIKSLFDHQWLTLHILKTRKVKHVSG